VTRYDHTSVIQGRRVNGLKRPAAEPAGDSERDGVGVGWMWTASKPRRCATPPRMKMAAPVSPESSTSGHPHCAAQLLCDWVSIARVWCGHGGER
jgi:hypothetical protein